MRCPFLREAQVKFCRASAYRKMIVRLPGQPENERCSSPDYVNCPAVKQHLEDQPSVDHCPFLHESLVQYCSAAAVTKYIPYSESLLSRCGTDSHTYCDLYLALAQPHESSETASTNETTSGHHHTVDDIPVPEGLYFSPNHMWMHVGSDGVAHIGIDAFLAKVLGSAEHITFVTTKGYHRPTVSFSVQGIDLQCVFPLQVNILRANTYLRTNITKIFTDPYTHGWLFEVAVSKQKNYEPMLSSFINSKESIEWMKHEVERMNTFAHHMSSQPDMHGAVLMADGGTFPTGMALRLKKEELLQLYNEFFSPLAVWNTQP